MPEMIETVEVRCRLVLIAPTVENADVCMAAAMKGGDVASTLVPKGELSDHAYGEHVEKLTPIAQAAGAAVIIEEDSQVMGRAGADGIFVPNRLELLKETIARFSPKRIVGYGGIKTRHNAMEAAECQPDFLFFGKTDGDIKPEAHPKNLKLGGWAAEVMQISTIVMGGSAIESVIEVAETGAEFVALSQAVFGDMQGVEAAVRRANELLDDHAPRFEDETA